MTDIQSMMLAVCFGAVVGTFIGNAIIIVKYALEERRGKKHVRKENKNRQ